MNTLPHWPSRELNMHVIDRDICDDVNAGNLVTDASTARLKPGEWPPFISLTIRSDQPAAFTFIRGDPDLIDGEIVGVRYHSQTMGVTLLVIND